MSKTEHANIHQAIVATMADVGYVQKESSRGLNYSFASEAALIQALRPVMVEHGIFCYVLSYTPEREKYETTKGTAMTATVASGVVRFVHAPTETFIDVMALGEGADAGDKSANKAMTGLLKYALRQTFLIETGDDPDRERPEAVHGEQKIGVWDNAVKKADIEYLASNGIIPPDANIKHVVALLNLSPFTPDAGLDLRWFKLYRGFRDQDADATAAAELASAEWEQEANDEDMA